MRNPPTIAPLAVSPAEAFRALGVSRALGYRLLANGALAAGKIGGRTVVPVAVLEAYVANLPSARRPAKPAKAA